MIINTITGRLLSNAARMSVLRGRVVQYSKTAAEEQRIFWEKNAKLNRPVSPHLTIYKFPLNAVTSVGHRGTGAAMSAVVIAFGLGSLYFTGDFDKVLEFIQYNIHPHVMLTLKTLLAFPIVYHSLTGVRHLIWDSGRGFSASTITKSGYLIIALAIIGAINVAML